jgi:predicted MPP superfamily phosphohydrolase
MRLAIAVPLLLLFLWAQLYWFLRLWRFISRSSSPILHWGLRALVALSFASVAVVLIATFFWGRRDLVWGLPGTVGVIGLWVSTAFLSWVGIRLVSAVGLLEKRTRAIFNRRRNSRDYEDQAANAAKQDVDLDRRRFVQGTAAIAGAVPFGVGAYGFFIGRHDYRVHELDLPISGLPRELEGLRIAQLSDIHIGSYMSATDVRRAVGMANDLNPDLSVVTGDFVTGPNDPLAACISELARLRSPLGVWGCNGNHEIYANAQEKAAELFARHGMKLLRQESAELSWRGGKFNLIGVDYQLARSFRGRPLTMLAHTGSLVRRDIPNVLLSHNPNSFPRAAELGIELMLTGHTHGGQVRVEILNHTFSPARFLTTYIAGLYKRPLGSLSEMKDEEAWNAAPSAPAALVYVNRGLGTIGAPVRLGVPPEISLLTLRCA